MSARVYISGLAGCALVDAPDAIMRVRVADATKAAGAGELRHFLRTYPDVTELETDEVNFEHVGAVLSQAIAHDRVLRFVLASLDRDHSLSLRVRAAAAVEKRLADPELASFLLRRLYSLDLPIEAVRSAFPALTSTHAFPRLRSTLDRFFERAEQALEARRGLLSALRGLKLSDQREALRYVLDADLIGELVCHEAGSGNLNRALSSAPNNSRATLLDWAEQSAALDQPELRAELANIRASLSDTTPRPRPTPRLDSKVHSARPSRLITAERASASPSATSLASPPSLRKGSRGSVFNPGVPWRAGANQNLAGAAPPDAHVDAAPEAEAFQPSEENVARIRLALDNEYELVWRALRRLGVPPALVEDATQTVFVTFARRIVDVAPGGERAFLLGICTRTAANLRRLAARRRELIQPDPSNSPEAVNSPEELLLRQERRTLLDDALESLSQEQRTVFVLYELEGFTLPEIADTLQIPLGTVSSRLRRARARFERWVLTHRRP